MCGLFDLNLYAYRQLYLRYGREELINVSVPHREPFSRQCPRRVAPAYRSGAQPPCRHLSGDALTSVEGGTGQPLHPAPEACIKPLLHALTARRARIRYQVTTPSKLLAKLRGWIPARWLDTLVAKQS